MGLFSNVANKAMEYIEEDTIRMKSSQGALECQIMLEEASDASFLNIMRAFVRMCNKGQEPERYFWMALDVEVKKKSIELQQQAVDILKNIDGPERYKALSKDLERYVRAKKLHESEQKKINARIEEIKIFKDKAQEMSTQKLQEKMNSTKSDIEKDAYFIELEQREEYRKKAERLSENDLINQCRDIKKGVEKSYIRKKLQGVNM